MKNLTKKRVLGLDLALRVSGYAIIEYTEETENVKVLDLGLLKNDSKTSVAKALEQLEKNLKTLIKEFKPTAISVEDCFIDKNPKVTLKLGMCQGIALLLAVKNHIEISTYPPKQIKLSISGSGFSSKEQLCYILENTLNLSLSQYTKDVSDALATALCHIYKTQKIQLKSQSNLKE